MKKQVISVCALVVMLIVGLSGCTSQNSSSDQSDVESKPPTTESVGEILSKADSIGSMYYEISMSITMPEYGTQTALMKIWQKKPYLKEQITSAAGGMTTSIAVIQRPDGTYVYDTTQGKYVLTAEVPSYVTALQYFDSAMMKDLLNNQSFTEFKAEFIDGKKATVLEYTLPLQGENLMTIKLWIWNERGVPLKAYMDMTMEEMTMTMDFVFGNYSFSEIPDSTFNVN